jgi:hypothetical protein
MKTLILALTLGFALAGTGLVMTKLPSPMTACIEKGC